MGLCSEAQKPGGCRVQRLGFRKKAPPPPLVISRNIRALNRLVRILNQAIRPSTIARIVRGPLLVVCDVLFYLWPAFCAGPCILSSCP